MFDYFKKHRLTISEDVSESRKPKRDKVFIVILIVFTVMLVVGFIAGNSGGTVESSEIENNFKFKFNISDGIIIGLLAVGYVVMRIRGRRDR